MRRHKHESAHEGKITRHFICCCCFPMKLKQQNAQGYILSGIENTASGGHLQPAMLKEEAKDVATAVLAPPQNVCEQLRFSWPSVCAAMSHGRTRTQAKMPDEDREDLTLFSLVGAEKQDMQVTVQVNERLRDRPMI